MAQNHYHILGVSQDADAQTIRRVYYRLAKLHHPDRNPHDPYADALFQRINEAYSVLGDEDARRHYDLRRQLSTRQTSEHVFYSAAQQATQTAATDETFAKSDLFARMVAKDLGNRLRRPRFAWRKLPRGHYIILGVWLAITLIAPSTMTARLLAWAFFIMYAVISTAWTHGLRALERWRPELLGPLDLFLVHTASFLVTVFISPPLLIMLWAAREFGNLR